MPGLLVIQIQIQAMWIGILDTYTVEKGSTHFFQEVFISNFVICILSTVRGRFCVYRYECKVAWVNLYWEIVLIPTVNT